MGNNSSKWGFQDGELLPERRTAPPQKIKIRVFQDFPRIAERKQL